MGGTDKCSTRFNSAHNNFMVGWICGLQADEVFTGETIKKPFNKIITIYKSKCYN